ncbi:30S ribosomal protein S15 [Candidatus Uhrbacteria bacterium RIFCSPLOWO2_02_FULL_49_11]|uniref:Small ribosomal subunit protein uS15 n=1 Tax=Candidatus Uhrbacteria bacterium RIFCSPLOWO2_02_FULL_49_11 TaxID=1802409 RepID=A0A1F7VAT3_9BACT|nr:MAG: 30S ribosomal protein S15 [Candidatus Uhrbacteria bacterium RIFCSPLOWO2_02_FULL_49_11]
MLTKKKKDAVIKKFRTHEHDTGSPEVQIAVLTEEMKELSEHLKLHRHDFSSRRGLLRKVSLRRRLLRYLQRENEARYEELAKKLKLKRLPAFTKDATLKQMDDEPFIETPVGEEGPKEETK